jgi:hypothetical protein
MTAIAKTDEQLAPEIVASLVLDGDMSKLAPGQRVDYYMHRCALIGVDPAEKPFQLVRLNGKLVLYADKTCANALTRVHGLSVEIRSRSIDGGLAIVEARATDRNGRYADDVGVVELGAERIGKANALMKCVTKAKRRAVLSLVGLGMLDVSEVEDVRDAQRVDFDPTTGEVVQQREPQRRRRPEPPQRPDEPPPLDVEVLDAPKCAGKAGGLARSNAWRRDLYAELLGKEPGAVWASCCKRLRIDGDPTPAQLTVEHGKAVRDLIKPAIEERIGERVLEVLEAEAKRKPNRSPVVELRGYISGVTKDARRWTALDDGERAEVLDAIRADASLGGGDGE